MDTLGFLTQELESKGASIQRLRQMMFGAKTETTRRVLGKDKRRGSGRRGGSKRKPRKGHGRNGAVAYRGAERDRLRCHLCGKVFTAEAPSGVGTEKYDETAASMIGLFTYGAGLPFRRLPQLEGDLGIPLPKATQWDVVKRAAGLLDRAYEELVRQAAQGELLHNDDTTMKILDFTDEARAEALPDAEAGSRTGLFTTGIVSVTGDRRKLPSSTLKSLRIQ